MTRKTVSSPSSKYRFLKRNTTGDGYADTQFERPPAKVPYKAILLASGLFLAGSILIIIGVMLVTGFIDAKYSDRTWPVMILGSLMFIPGVYHVRIAYCAYRGYEGYSYEDIPEYD